jgi:hypothetical protein
MTTALLTPLTEIATLALGYTVTLLLPLTKLPAKAEFRFATLTVELTVIGESVVVFDPKELASTTLAPKIFPLVPLIDTVPAVIFPAATFPEVTLPERVMSVSEIVIGFPL